MFYDFHCCTPITKVSRPAIITSCESKVAWESGDSPLLYYNKSTQHWIDYHYLNLNCKKKQDKKLN